MSFNVIFVSLIFIGSSFAASDYDQIRSLAEIHSRVFTYSEEFARQYGGLSMLKISNEYQNYVAHTEIITNAKNAQPVPSATQVIQAWRTVAVALINKNIEKANEYLQNEGYMLHYVVKPNLVAVTQGAINGINGDQNIISTMRGNGCPIYNELQGVVNKYNTTN